MPEKLLEQKQKTRRRRFRFVLYTLFAAVAFWSVSEVWQTYQHHDLQVQATAILKAEKGYYRLAQDKGWVDTLWMDEYMQDTLTSEQYEAWRQLRR